MNTQRLDILKGDYDSEIKKAAKLLKQGGIVAIPTETVYGLAASALSDSAIKKVFAAKGRPQDNPLIVHISDMEMLNKVAVDIPDAAYILAEKFWAGPLTLVLKKSNLVCDSVSAGLDTVAVRMPLDSVARDIIAESGLPLAAPSANLSGLPSPTTAADTLLDLDNRVDAVVMGKDCMVGVESTVISLVTNPPRLLRPGAITVEQLREILPDLAVDKAVLSEPQKDERVASPGMKYKHYAPKTEAYLVEGDSQSFCEYANKSIASVALCFGEETNKINIKKVAYGSLQNPASLAQNVFSALRQADKLSGDKILIHAPSKKGISLAVYNRLIRAAAFRVIKL